MDCIQYLSSCTVSDMEVRHRYDCWLPRVLGVSAITLYPWVLYSFPLQFSNPWQEDVMRHEMVHVGQVREFGWLSFYVSYLVYYLAGLVRYKSHSKAYYSNPYEREAYGVD